MATNNIANKFYLLGRYTVQIVCKPELLNMFSSFGWGKYEKGIDSGNSNIVLDLEDTVLQSESELPEGWSFQELHSEKRLSYTHMGNPVFTLHSKVQDYTTICIKGSTARNIHLGIQFGLLFALYRHCVGLHGVTLLCANEIIILSAPSGTGKTTLASLLEQYCDAIVINGDFALLSITKDGVLFEPTPFCGTSGRALNHRFRVDRVVFLGQAEKNHWRELDGREAMTRFMSNAFVPDWDKDILQAVQENILKCVSMLKVDAYDFAPTQEAAKLFLRKVKGDASSYSG